MHYYDVLLDEFKKESDRAAVILAASIIDELLRDLLVARLVPVSSSTDDLFDGANAPLGTFSSRIEMAFRTGLVSGRFARDLHLIRRIRNEFAHNVQGCSFEDTRVKSRVAELSNSHGIISRSPNRFRKTPTTRKQFLEGVGWMVFALNGSIQDVKPLALAEEEWGYSFSHDEDYVAQEKAAEERREKRRTAAAARKLAASSGKGKSAA